VGSVAWWYQGAAGRTELAVHPLVADAEALLERGQHVALLARLLEQAPILFARAEPKDAECCFLVMANIVPRLPHSVRRPFARALRGLLEPQPLSPNGAALKVAAGVLKMQQSQAAAHQMETYSAHAFCYPTSRREVE